MNKFVARFNPFPPSDDNRPIFDELTRRRTSNRDTAQLLLDRGLTREDKVCADSAEPKSIADYNKYGVKTFPARKGPKSVRYGTKWLQMLEAIVIDPERCPDTAKEFSEYEYERDAKTGEVLEGYPDINNHHIDAVRYAMESTANKAGDNTAMDNLVDSVITAGNNIIPRIKEIVPTLIDGLSELVTQLAPYVSGVIMELEPTIEEGLQSLFGGLSSVANELQPIVADVFSFFGDAIISGLTSAIENSDFSFLLDIFDNVKTEVEEVVPVIEEIAPALVTVGAAVKGWQIGTKIQKMVTAFDEAKVAVSLFSMGLSDTEIAQGALNGTLKASEVLAGLLTGKISLMTLAQAAAAKAQAAFNAVLAANPIALVVVAIGALVGILAVLYAKNEDFRNGVNAAWDAISAKIQEVVAFVQPYIEAAMQVIGQVVTQVITDLTPVIQSIGAAFSAAWSLVQTVWAWASAFFQAIFQSIVVIFAPFAPIISGFFQGAWIIIQSIWNVAVSFFQTVFNLITGVFSTIDAVLSGDFQGAWESIQGIFEGVFDFFSTVGQNVVEGIKGGIAAMWGGLVSFVQGLWDGIKSIFTINAGDVKNNTGVNGSHAGGLDYVPYNNYVANLHRGEMVLTADEAEAYRRGNSGVGGFTVNQTIFAAKQTPVELAASTAAYFQRARWAI